MARAGGPAGPGNPVKILEAFPANLFSVERGTEMTKVKSEKAEKAQALYQSGWKLTDIAQALNIPSGTIYRWKSVYEWNAAPEISACEGAGPCKRKLVCDLIKSGWKQVEIAEVLGVHPNTVWEWKNDSSKADVDREVMAYRRKVQSRKNRDYYRKEVTRQELCSTVRKNFQRAALLTFSYQPDAPMSWDSVRKFLRTHERFMRLRLLKKYGLNFEFVRIVEYVSLETGEMQFRYITDLTEEQCKVVAADRVMAEARIEDLPMGNLWEALAPINVQDGYLRKGEPHRKAWACTRGVRQ